MPYEQIDNPTGKGAESFKVSALALSPDGKRVAGATPDFGSFFDAEFGQQGATWQEPSGFEHIVFREDGALIVVAQALAMVDPTGKRSKLSPKKIFRGDDAPHEAIIANDVLIALHGWETKNGEWASAMVGVSLEDGSRLWELEAELHGLVTHRGLVIASHENDLVVIEPETGDISVLASLPARIGAAWSNGRSLYLAEREGFALHRIDSSGGVAASASMEDPIPMDDKPPPAIVQMARLGDELVVRMRNHSPANLGPVPWMSEDTLELLDTETLEPLEHGLGLPEVCEELEWAFSQPETMLTVGDDLWLGMPEGLLRFTP